MAEHGPSEAVKTASTTKLLQREVANLRRQLKALKRQRELLVAFTESSSPDREGA